MTARRLAAACAAFVSCALLAEGAEAQRLGRLFSTPEQRMALEEARREYELSGQEPETPVDQPRAEQPAPVVSQLEINGVVLRSSGNDATWINGSPVLGGMTREGLRVTTDRASGGGVRITLPSGVETVQLRPGQKIDVVSGSVVEVYERRQVDEADSAFEIEAEAPVTAADLVREPLGR